MFVRNDCKTFRFCSSKCHKHFKMKHNPRKMKLTKTYRKARGKEMTLDSSFDFEKKRNTAVRYDRDLWIKTVQAMQRVAKIKAVRKERFHKHRLAVQLRNRQSTAEKEIARSQHLVSMVPKLKQKKKEEALFKLKVKAKAKVVVSSGGDAMES